MGGIEIVGIVIVALNVIWGLVYLVSKGMSAEAIAVMTAAVGALSAVGAVYARYRKGSGSDDGGQ